jgi:ribulose-5-phosphate 4-epimerase/fuculose-1-phosphate aldolase
VFVSKRNIDKRDISFNSFVQTCLDIGYSDFLLSNVEELQVHYIGNCKPSVDTPIQLLLYQYYKHIRFMIHSHTYIKNASFTHEIIPCGAIDEFYEIIKIFPDYTLTNIQLNLKGHGSIVMVRHLEDLRNIQYIPRIIPEI